MRIARTANEHVLSHGMEDTREALADWRDGRWRVLRGWFALSLCIALALLTATWVVSGLLTPDLTPWQMPGLTEPSRLLRPAADPLPQRARPRPARDRLRRRVHRRLLDAARGRAADRVLALDPREGGRAGDPLRRRGDPLLARTQALYLGFQGSTLAYQLHISRLELILSVLPHALIELTALFLPLAAWLIASRRGEWNQCSRRPRDRRDRGPDADRRGDDRGLRLAAHPALAQRLPLLAHRDRALARRRRPPAPT